MVGYYMMELVDTVYTEPMIIGERISDITTGIKSIWRGNDGRECTVEEVAIEYYQKQGYRGYVSRILLSATVVSCVQLKQKSTHGKWHCFHVGKLIG